jgi:hypothetical protein
MLSSYEEELRKSREQSENFRELNGHDQRGYPGRVRFKKAPKFDKQPRPGPPGPPGQQSPYGPPDPASEPMITSNIPPKENTKPGPEPTQNPSDKERMDEPYLTFPGYMYGDPSGPYPPDPRFGPPPGGLAAPGMPPSYYPPYYPYYPRRPLDAFGATALTLGIVSICLFWLPLFPFSIGTLFYVVVISLAGIAMIFGGYSFASKRRRSIHGLVGMILAIVAVVLSTIIWTYVFTRWGYYDFIQFIPIILLY